MQSQGTQGMGSFGSSFRVGVLLQRLDRSGSMIFPNAASLNGTSGLDCQSIRFIEAIAMIEGMAHLRKL